MNFISSFVLLSLCWIANTKVERSRKYMQSVQCVQEIIIFELFLIYIDKSMNDIRRRKKYIYMIGKKTNYDHEDEDENKIRRSK